MATFRSPLSGPSARALCAAAFALAALAPGSARAQLAPYYNQLMNTIQQQAVNYLLSQMGLSAEAAVAQSGGATQAEILKGAIANKGVMEGLEAYRQTQQLQVAAQETAESLRQPATTCQTIAVQGSLGNATQQSRARVALSQAQVLRDVTGTTNTLQLMERTHKASNDTFCTAEENARGICRVNPQFKDLAGADQSAAYLFQGRDGSPSFDNSRGGAQARAADNYIRRVVAGLPAEQLRGAQYSKSPQSRAYIEIMRRYAAVLSMSSYSLNHIKEARTAVPGLGTDTTMANAPGFPVKVDMSMMEALQRFVATKFSPDSIRDAAKATNPNLILRDLAQMNAFQLWMEQQTLLQDSRTEALMAHQLALLTEQTLRPQLEAQRLAALRAATTRR